MTSNSTHPRRALIALCALSVALVIAALIAVALRGAPGLRAENTPAGVVQRYVLAIQASDYESAHKFVRDEHKNKPCDAYVSQDQTLQMTLTSEKISGSHASVGVSFDQSGSIWMQGWDSYGWQDQFTLNKVDSTWLIETMPWNVGLCTDEELGY